MKQLVLNTFKLKKVRGWDTVAWAVDIHDTVVVGNYSNEISKEWLPGAKETLQKISNRPDCLLILFTCSFPNEIKQYLEFFKENEIDFKYVNENPEVKNTAFGCFDKKFYANIYLENKAGFIAERDWAEINEALCEIDLIDDFLAKNEKIIDVEINKSSSEYMDGSVYVNITFVHQQEGAPWEIVTEIAESHTLSNVYKFVFNIENFYKFINGNENVRVDYKFKNMNNKKQ